MTVSATDSTIATPRKGILIILCIVALAGVAFQSFSWYVPLDDAYITFRYARNVAAGRGLCYNAGERVEGYSCPLWLMIMLIGPTLGLAHMEWATLLSFLCLVLGVWLLLALVWVEAGDRRLASGTILVLLFVFHPQTSMLVSSGMEPLLSALILVGVVTSSRRSGWMIGFFLFLASVNRPEGILYLVPVGAYLAWRRRPFLGAVAVPAIAWTLSRLGSRLYFGTWLPNTFHAKVGSSAAQLYRGLRYLADYFLCTPTGVAALLALILILLAHRRLRRILPDGVVLSWLIVLSHAAFLILVGGGPGFVYRHLAPAYFVLLYGTAWGLAQAGRGLSTRLLKGAALALLLAYGAGISWQMDRLRTVERHHQYIDYSRREAARWLLRTERPGTLIAANAIGVVGYFTDLPVLDLLGLVDPVIARTPNMKMGRGVAGHERYNVSYMLDREPKLLFPRGIILSRSPLRWEDLGRSFVEGDRALLSHPRVRANYDLRSVKLGPGHLNVFVLKKKAKKVGP